MGPKIAIQQTLSGKWEWLVTDAEHYQYADGVEPTWAEAFRMAHIQFVDMIDDEDVTIDRDNQQTDVIYVGKWGPHSAPFTGLAIFTTPDGEGRYYFDSVAEARRELVYGENFTVRYVARIED